MRRSILIVLFSVSIMGFAEAQQRQRMTIEEKKDQKLLENETLKHRFKELFEEGNLIMKADQVMVKRKMVPGVSREANYLKFDGKIVYLQHNLNFPGGDHLEGHKIGWVRRVDYKDNGPGKSLRIRFRYGTNPDGGQYQFMTLTVRGKKVHVKSGSGYMTMEGEWGDSEEMFVEKTRYEMAKLRLPFKEYVAAKNED